MTSPTQHSRNGTQTPVTREWVPEVPVALEFNGLAYAVMMATPADLEDFALGFALTEGLAATPADCTDIAVVEVEKGWIVKRGLKAGERVVVHQPGRHSVLLNRVVPYTDVLTVLLVGAIAGVVAHVPAGIGVFEVVFVSLLGHRVPEAQLLAALLGYRAIYYIAPMAIASVMYLVMELKAKKLKSKRAIGVRSQFRTVALSERAD